MKSFIVMLIMLFSCQVAAQQPPYKNPTLPVEERVQDLLQRMTLQEKFWQCFMIPGDFSQGRERYKHGIFGLNASGESSLHAAGQVLDSSPGHAAAQTAERINSMQKFFLEETRLGIPIIPFDEALHGLVRKGATVFPQAIGLAATWDTSLMHEVAAAIADEVRSRGIRQVLSPVVNIARDPRWGRTEETYGEDPFLTTQMAIAFITRFEMQGVITTPKHFAVNTGDGGRDSYPIHFNERLLEEIYFPPFKAAVQTGGATSIMTAYNSLDGRQCTANNWLLVKKLKQQWEFTGFVISDAGATGGANVLHFTAKDYAESTKQALENGLDVIFQTSYDHYPLFWEAFEKGMIDSAAVDGAVRRVLRAKFRLGLFDDPYVNPDTAAAVNSRPAHLKLARIAAQKSIVLLKNRNNILPLDSSYCSIAVIGTDAIEARLGGYSGPGSMPVSILQGIKKRAGSACRITFAPGCGRHTLEFVTVPSGVLYHYEQGEKQPGLHADYFNNPHLRGDPALTRIDPGIDFRWTLFSPAPGKINPDWYSVRWTGILVPAETGRVDIGLQGDDGFRLYIDGKLIIDNWRKQSYRRLTRPFLFERGKEYTIKVEFYETRGNVRLNLIWNMGIHNTWQKDIKRACAAAVNSDIAIVSAGIEEGEFRDRAFLLMPGHQEELIRLVAATGTPVVVIITGGSAYTMDSWLEHASALLNVWYPGEQGGHAVADILFGDTSPAGRLPITFPLSETQLPLYYNHKPTGRGDDYINLTGKPLFPFGYGLSYTTFEYSGLTIEKPLIGQNEDTTVRFRLTNSGGCDGDEVVQLYIKDLYASVARPVIELKGFQRIFLKKGMTKEVSFTITPDLLAMENIHMNRTVEPGEFRIMIGASSRDIRLRGSITVKNILNE